jgi:serine/threonine protein kinase
MKAGFGTETGDSGATAQARFTPPTLEELAAVFPQFEVLSFIGQGGMGAVYKARQKQLDRIVALKILPPSIGQDPAFAERFAREARAMARLNHPGIVTIYDFGQAQTGGDRVRAELYYFIMEFVDGVSLRQLLQAGRVAPREALAIVPQICDALQYAHDQGIVHRDIKPENILMDRQGRVKVADFGLAKLVGTGMDVSETGKASVHLEGLTDAGKIMGTPNYMAPEQVEHPAEVDHRVDLYALGVVFYQMLTGELPSKRIEPPSRKVQLDVRLDEIVLRALERVPERRYQTAGELKTVVETVAAEPGKSASTLGELGAEAGQPESGPSALGPQSRTFTPGTEPGGVPRRSTVIPGIRRSRAAIAGAILAAVFILVILAWFLDWPESRDPGFGRTLSQIVFHNAVLPTGIAALLSSTVLGWIAMLQIRRSAGRIRGLGLAMFDGLFVPILVADFLVVMVWAFVAKALAASRGLGGSMFRDLWEFVVFSLVIGLTAGCVNYLVIGSVWRAVTNKISGEVLNSAVRTRRRLRLVAIVSGLTLTCLYPASVLLSETSRKARYGWGVEQGTELTYQVLEANADLVDREVPFDVRDPGNAVSNKGIYILAQPYTAVAQMAEIEGAFLTDLLAHAPNSGLLVDAVRKGQEIYQWSADGWSYDNAWAKGKGEGFCGMGRDRQSARFRIRYRVSHTPNGSARYPVSAEISYEGPTPPVRKARAFFIPFVCDQQSKYLVIAFRAKAPSAGTDEETLPIAAPR